MKASIKPLLLFLVTYCWNVDISAQQLVKDIIPGGTSSIPNSFATCNGLLFFHARIDQNQSPELWKSDGTTAGTEIVKKINPNYGAIPANGDNRMVSIGNQIFFKGNDGIYGDELWKTDGTQAGTIMVKDIAPNGANGRPENLIKMNGILYFMAYDDDFLNNRELWRSDGTEAGTYIIKDILPGIYGQTTSSEDMVVLNDILYFSARVATNGSQQLWKSDGTEIGTEMIWEGQYFYIKNLNVFENNLYFSGYDELYGAELWKSDGTTAGTGILIDINPGSSDSYIEKKMIEFNGELYFIAKTAANGVELWKTDGSNTNTIILKDINPGAVDGITYFTPLKVLNGNLYFTANNGVNGFELWKTDGTELGTQMVTDLKPGSTDSFSPLEVNQRDFEVVGNYLYFSANDGNYGYELWKSDGTEIGTTLVKDIQLPGSTIGASSDPALLYNYNDILVFTADDGFNGRELWALNTTLEINDIGVSGVENIYPNPANNFITIENNNDQLNSTYIILNSLGQNVLSGQLIGEANTIDISGLSNGIYLVQIETNSGRVSKKIIKN